MGKFLRRRYDISSRQNDRFKWVKDLWNARSVRQEKACLVFGHKIVKELVQSGRHKILFECLRGSDVSMVEGVDILQFSSDLFDEIDELGTKASFLVVQTPPIEEWVQPPPPPSGLELVLPFSDPTNLGAAVRSAKGFGVEQIILTNEASHPFLPRSIRASAGAVFGMKFKHGPPLAEICQQMQGLKIGSTAVLDIEGTAVHDFPWTDKMYLIAGEEGRGVPKIKIPRARIPTQNIESLNAAVAVSVALFAYRVRFPLRKQEMSPEGSAGGAGHKLSK